ncbi:MAG: bifunctional methylenetetrahydrofolate dehydrogenase/methenyltetrahydrofolate cyclohydrolase [Actinobacteria bacterium]|jgi:methylenetetrahydrofolate dehydrogenase (NADP+)/methenyltetrahydrofolate cyclohydrolase|nr:bifunctional methylenetetrahydrofolate dehydrogenase/methenyltetrahydrofolate cyclohydrolase [Actinomycetota bacterium]NDB07945.1 bifunctional methylenetetrahydrofolate dehydrogenase/methenyltetrahydrofolate cyclohydrolase [Actinomycetota bacterium]
MALILDGRAAAKEIKAELSNLLKGKKYGLGTILVGEDPGSRAYVAGKHRDCAEIGIDSIRIDLPAKASEAEILDAVKELNENSKCTGFIVQLPLPEGINVNKVLEAINPKKDADGLHPLNLGRLVLNQATINPCTPQAIIELLSRNKIAWAGKEVVVIGRGATVGRPLGLLLSQKKINATVTLTHTGTKNLSELTKRADIIIAAIGKAHFLTKEMVTPKAVVIDVGLTREGEKLLGDVNPNVYQVVEAYSPVPGGVGPMTRAMLLRNVIELGEKV